MRKPLRELQEAFSFMKEENSQENNKKNGSTSPRFFFFPEMKNSESVTLYREHGTLWGRLWDPSCWLEPLLFTMNTENYTIRILKNLQEVRRISFTIPIYTEVCVLKAALNSNSADLLGRLKSSRHYTPHRNRFISFPFLICFVLTCRVYLDLVGSLELMAELVSW